MAGIYLHIPFCKQACYYCDFHFSTSTKRKPEIVAAINTEIRLQAHLLKDEEIETIYFGGGTPSLLEFNELKSILNTLTDTFKIAADIEITLEANPDDLSLTKLKELKLAGINRLSVGIQSYKEADLKFMNRAHNSEEALQCIVNAKNAGFDNISIDLIYGIPNLSMKEWEKHLEISCKFGIKHISAYALTVEEDTAYHHYIKQGIQPAPKEELAAKQFHFMVDFLKEKGYEQYEISNFSLPNAYSKHNSSYWKKKSYLGIGPSAHSYYQNKRQWNIANNALYIKNIKEGKPWFEEETLSLSDQYNEYIMTGLRTKWGCNLDDIENQFGEKYKHYFTSSIDTFINQGKIEQENKTYRLTAMGKFFADGISADLFYV